MSLNSNLLGVKYVITGVVYVATSYSVESTGRELYYLESPTNKREFIFLYREDLVGHRDSKVKDVVKEITTESEDRALRYNEGKPELSMVDTEIINLMAFVLMYGATKYPRDNWKKGFPRELVMDSLLRHAHAYANGEDNDEESGLSHLGHVATNAMFLAYYKKNGMI